MVLGATRRGASGDVLLCASALGAACLLLYGGALQGFFLADDYTIIGSFWGKRTGYLVKLLVSDEIGGIWPEKFIRPIRPWSLTLDGWIWGLEPLGFHLTNLLLHVATATAIAALVFQLGGGLYAALPASLLFFLHPVNVEVATWVSGRDESLAGAALLASVSCHLAAVRGLRKVWLSLGGAFFTVSLFAKEYALLLPAAMWAWALLAPSEGSSRVDALKKSAVRSVRLLGIIAVFLALRFHATGNPLGGYGAGASAHAALRPDLLLASFVRFGADLCSPLGARPLAAAALALGFLIPLAMTRTPNAAPRPALIVFWALLWPTLFLLPTHNLVYTPRHLYISFAGVAVAFGLLLARTLGKWRSPQFIAISAALPLLLAPPTLAAVDEYMRMSERCRVVLTSVELAAKTFPDGDVLVLVGMPAHQSPPWGFGWSLPDALRPPFVSKALESRLEIVSRRQWRPEAWDAYRVKYPGRGIHVLAWNPAFMGIEFLREDGSRGLSSAGERPGSELPLPGSSESPPSRR